MKSSIGLRLRVAWDALVWGRTVVNVPVTVNVGLYVDGRKLGGCVMGEHLAFISENVESAVVKALQDELMKEVEHGD